METTVNYEVKERICTITLNRPEKFNALSLQLVRDLMSALKKAEADISVGVVVLKGAGKAWCAGGDLEELLTLTEGSAADRREYLLDFKARWQSAMREGGLL